MASALSSKPLGLTFSVLGFVQGVIWLFMSILGILIYEEVIFKDANDLAKKPTLSVITFYIRGFHKNLKDKNAEILIFLIVYSILSFCWTVVSGYQLVLFQKKKLNNLKSVLYQWIGLTTAISVLDVAFVGIVAKDYSDFKEIDDLDLTGLVIILAVAARGCVIWIINVAGIIICFRLVKQVKQEEIKQSRYNDTVQAIQAFDNLQASPSHWYSEVINDENPVPRITHVNPSFIDDENQNRSMVSRQTNYDPKLMDNQSAYSRQSSYDPNPINEYFDQDFRYTNQDNWNRNFADWNDPIAYNKNSTGNDWNGNKQNKQTSNITQNHRNAYRYTNSNDLQSENGNKQNKQTSNITQKHRDAYRFTYSNDLQSEKKPIKILDMELIPVEELEPPTVPPPDYTPPNTPLVRARSVLKSNPIYN